MAADGEPPVNGVAFGDGGAILASANADGTVWLWDVANHGLVGRPMAIKDKSPVARFINRGSGVVLEFNYYANFGPKAGFRPPIGGMAFSPSGRMLASAYEDGTVRLWYGPSQREVGLPMTAGGGAATAVAFSRGGTILASADADGTVRLWNTDTQRDVGLPMTAGAGSSNGIAFSPGGGILATADSDGTARLWDISTQHQIGAPITVSEAATQAQVGLPLFSSAGVNAVAFSPDGRTLVTASGDGTVRQWDVALPSNLIHAVCAIAGHSLTRAEWNAYVPSEGYQRICL